MKQVKSIFFLTLFTFLTFSIQAQNVGINTRTPGSALEIRGEGVTDTTSALNVTDVNGVSNFRVGDDGRIGVGTTTPGARFMVVGEAGFPTLNVLSPAGNNPSFRVNDNGRVGIGTATPGAKFMVVGEAGAPAMNILSDGTMPMLSLIHI